MGMPGQMGQMGQMGMMPGQMGMMGGQMPGQMGMMGGMGMPGQMGMMPGQMGGMQVGLFSSVFICNGVAGHAWTNGNRHGHGRHGRDAAAWYDGRDDAWSRHGSDGGDEPASAGPGSTCLGGSGRSSTKCGATCSGKGVLSFNNLTIGACQTLLPG